MDELDAVGSRGGVPQTMEPYPFHEPFRHGLEDRVLEGTREEPRRGGILGFVDRFFVGGMGAWAGCGTPGLRGRLDSRRSRALYFDDHVYAS
jgi:hypothetical protein